MTRSPVFVRGGKVLDPHGELDQPPIADILILEGRIAAIGPQGSLESSRETRVIDATGMLVTPGFINAHYHSHDVLLRGMFEQMPLEVWGLYSFPSSYPRRHDDEIWTRTLLGAAENLRCGVTTVQDMATIVGPDRNHVGALLSAYQEAGIRAVVALQFGDRAAADTVPFWRDRLSPQALSQLGGDIDSAPMQDLISALLAMPRAERLTWALGPSAPQRCSEQLLTWVARVSEEFDLQVFTHVYETRSQAVLARVSYQADHSSLVSLLARLGLLNKRLTIAHGVWITDTEIEELGGVSANLVFNPISNLKLLNGIAPIRRYADAGVNIALGCDNCSGNDAQNIFESMKTFALWWGLQSEVGESGAACKAFQAATLGGAKALGKENEIGALQPGMRADLVLMNLDDPSFVPLNSAVRQLVYAGTPRAIHTVLVDGEVVVEAGRMKRFDERRVGDAARKFQSCLCDDHRIVSKRMAPLACEVLEIHRTIANHPVEIDRLRLNDPGSRK
jgi:5-methylthioadenosine/S-adenosylhomocysteine deaminase